MAFSSCIYSEDMKEQQRRNSEIEKELEREKLEARKKIKILMLGTEGCGKSSVVLNMRGIYGQGYTEEDKHGLVKYIHQQVMKSISDTIKEIEEENLKFSNAQNEENKSFILNASSGELTPSIFYGCIPAIESIWSDPVVQENFRTSQIDHESEKYFLSHAKRIGNPDYVPSVQDIVRLQIVPQDSFKEGLKVIEYPLVVDEMPVRLIHLHDQRPEWRRDIRKWIHYFDDVNCILFLVSLSHYDQTVTETDINRLQEDRDVFQAILDLHYFKNAAVILLFTKDDLLKEKLQKSSLAKYFPAFKGPEKDPVAVREFICQMFLDANVNPKRHIYPHFVCSTDADVLKQVFKGLKDSVLRAQKKSSKKDTE